MKKVIELIFFICIGMGAEERADFIILGDPGVYTILNKFEQPLSAAEKELFRSGAPLQILSHDATLGDQITSAAKCRYEFSLYYLLLDEHGNYLGGKKDAKRQLFMGCLAVDDTVEITQNKAVALYHGYPSQGKTVFLDKGSVIIRLFKYKDSYYVRQVGRTEQYGWLSSASSRATRRQVTTAQREETGFQPELVKRIEDRFAAVNKVYTQYFTYFNEKTKKQKSVPQWQCHSEKNVIQCVLSGPYKNAKQLEESTDYLVQDLESMLFGKHCSVIYANGEIRITPGK